MITKMSQNKKMPVNQFIFLSHKTGIAKTGKPYEIVEVSKDHKNFSINLDEKFDRSVFDKLDEYDIVEITFRVEGGFDGRASAVATAMSQVKAA